MKIWIDTNIYSNTLKNIQTATEILEIAETIFISPIVIAELLSGFKYGSRENENRSKFNQFLDSPRVIISTIGEFTAEHYANIFLQLKKTGKPIPTNDIWIAACAMENGAPLATFDRHFSNIQGLLLVPLNN